MIKKFLNIFRLANIVFLIFGVISVFSYAEAGKISLKILYTESPFISDDDNENVFVDNFFNAISSIHPPVLVTYDNHQSLLLFIAPKKEDPDKHNLIYNFNLSNHKMNEVGRIYGDKILSVFGYGSKPEEIMVLILTKDVVFDEELYNTTRVSVLKEEEGLYIQSFKTDRIGIEALNPCIDTAKSTCKYKDAASIKSFFDDAYNQKK